MVPDILLVLGVGGLLGFRHAFEPDHLAAVSTLASRQGSLWSAARLGLAWGVGHTATVGAIAVLVVALGVRVPAALWPTAELVVAGLPRLRRGGGGWGCGPGRGELPLHPPHPNPPPPPPHPKTAATPAGP